MFSRGVFRGDLAPAAPPFEVKKVFVLIFNVKKFMLKFEHF